MEKIILIGAGGHSKSVVDSLDKDQYKVVGFLDENKTGTHLGLPIMGKCVSDIENYLTYKYFVAIGDVSARKMWFEKLKELQLDVINIIDKTAYVSPTAKMGIGNFIGKFAVINADSVIGNNNIINTRALIEHECTVGSHTHISTNSVINGNVTVEDGVFFGSCAVCNGQLKIGRNAVIGSGSVVINDIEPCTVNVGVPARAVKRRQQYDEN